MQLSARLAYSACVLVAVSMVVLLATSIAEGLGAGSNVDIQSVLFSPFYLGPVYLGAFAVAPALSARMRISGDESMSLPKGKAPFGYAVRSLALVFAGIALAGLLALAIFALGKLI